MVIILFCIQDKGGKMTEWKEIIYGIIFVFAFIFGFIFVREQMCNFYGMDYSFILNQCIIRR